MCITNKISRENSLVSPVNQNKHCNLTKKIIFSEIDILLVKMVYQIETLQLDEKNCDFTSFFLMFIFPINYISAKVTNRINDTRYQARMQLFIYL